jgi:uncharacterized protein
MLTLAELRAGLFNDSVVLQPTTLCNLNCSYCYLPERQSRTVMSIDVTTALAKDFEGRTAPVTILWHGGEPLATGVRAMRDLLQPFEDLRKRGLVKHTLQTNATLIDQQWIRLLKDFHFSLGVSIDGPGDCNESRVTWSSQPALGKALRGVELLREARIRFGIIVVVSERNVRHAKEVYNFAVDLGCSSNGLHGEIVSEFWSELLDAWLEQPAIEVREFRQALGWTSGVLQDTPAALGPRRRELYPTISCQGDVVLLSPEFIGAPSDERQQFVVGNVLETPLSAICEMARTRVDYVTAFLRGIQQCEASCTYFAYCRGGTASNKYFETGAVEATVTHFCMNNKQRVMDAILDRARKEVVPQ